MKLGYLAIDEQSGETLALTGTDTPRKQLLAKLDRKSAKPMYCDTKDGRTKHTGWIVAGRWFRVLEVHEWEGATKP